VNFHDAKGAAWLQEVGHDAGPAVQVGQPRQHAIGRDHDVELSIEHIRHVVEVGADKTSLDIELFGERASHRDRFLRVVGAGHERSEARPRERVHSKVALKVKQRSTSNVTELLLLERVKGDASLSERCEVVEVGIQVNLGPEGPSSHVLGHALAVVRAGHLHRVAATPYIEDARGEPRATP